MPDPRTAEERLRTDAIARLLQVAASQVRGEGVCEKPHRNGERNPHVHFNDGYIARGRDIAWAVGVLYAALAAEPVPVPLDVERLADWLHSIEEYNAEGTLRTFAREYAAIATPPEPKP